MRKAYIGLSGPIAFDYRNQFEKFHEKESSSPNPIIENAMGLLLFYDELLFACPQVCPKSLRNLSYVKFLSSYPDYDIKIKFILSRIENLKYEDYKELSERVSSKLYGEAVQNIFGDSVSFSALNNKSKYLLDHHTHGIYLGAEKWFRASSYEIRNWLFDLEVLKEFNLVSHDPIFNTNTLGIAEENGHEKLRTFTLSNELIVRNIPNYINEKGPYHESIEELRQHKFLSDFRIHLDEIFKNEKSKEIQKLASEIESTADKARRSIFEKYMSNYNNYLGIAKAAGSDIVGFFVPGTGTAMEIVNTFKERREKANLKWVAFLNQLEQKS